MYDKLYNELNELIEKYETETDSDKLRQIEDRAKEIYTILETEFF